MIPYLVYEAASGRILSICTATSMDSVRAAVSAGMEVLLWVRADDERHYVVGGAIAERPTLDVADVTLEADGTEQVVAFGVPDGTRVERAGVSLGTVDSTGLILFAPVAPAAWRLTLRPPFPFRTAHIEVTIR